MEAQVREQLSFFPVLLQVSVAFGATSPGGHLTSSERENKSQIKVTQGGWTNGRSETCVTVN